MVHAKIGKSSRRGVCFPPRCKTLNLIFTCQRAAYRYSSKPRVSPTAQIFATNFPSNTGEQAVATRPADPDSTVFLLRHHRFNCLGGPDYIGGSPMQIVRWDVPDCVCPSSHSFADPYRPLILPLQPERRDSIGIVFVTSRLCSRNFFPPAVTASHHLQLQPPSSCRDG